MAQTNTKGEAIARSSGHGVALLRDGMWSAGSVSAPQRGTRNERIAGAILAIVLGVLAACLLAHEFAKGW